MALLLTRVTSPGSEKAGQVNTMNETIIELKENETLSMKISDDMLEAAGFAERVSINTQFAYCPPVRLSRITNATL